MSFITQQPNVILSKSNSNYSSNKNLELCPTITNDRLLIRWKNQRRLQKHRETNEQKTVTEKDLNVSVKFERREARENEKNCERKEQKWPRGASRHGAII